MQEQLSSKVIEPPLQLYFLGGLEEIGMNATLLRYGKRSLLIDCGVAFPDKMYMPGVSIVHANFESLAQQNLLPEALLLTHGHQDHIGAVPYLLKQKTVPIYASSFTKELLKKHLERYSGKTEIFTLEEETDYSIGPFQIQVIQVPHSIPQSLAVRISISGKQIVFSGDLKLNLASSQSPSILRKIAKWGKTGVDLLCCESTNVETLGYASSEETLLASFRSIFETTEAALHFVIISTQIERLKLLFQLAKEYGRSIYISSSSIEENLLTANKCSLGPSPLGRQRLRKKAAQKYPKEKLLIISTGAQAEPLSSIVRLLNSGQNSLRIEKNDTVVWSAKWIPGNQRAIASLIDKIVARGARVLDSKSQKVHVSGHGYQEDLKVFIQLLQPLCVLPIHGYRRQRKVFIEWIEKEELSLTTLFCENNSIITLKDSIVLEEKKLQAVPVYRCNRQSPPISLQEIRSRRQLARDGFFAISIRQSQRGLSVQFKSKGLPETQEEWQEELRSTLEEKRSQNTTKEQQETEIQRICKSFFRKRWQFSPQIITFLHQR